MKLRSVRTFFLQRLDDIRAAAMTLPDAKTWWRCLIVFAAFVACALPVGFASGFFQPEVAPIPTARLALLPLYLFLRPALVEELIFRAALLPRDPKRVRMPQLIVVSALALTVFVASHPLHGLLTRPAALPLFLNPVFLSCATLLGIACTVSYLVSRSLWPPVLLHWLSVLIWITLLGGNRAIGAARPPL